MNELQVHSTKGTTLTPTNFRDSVEEKNFKIFFHYFIKKI
jgi:hypothetical protein